MSTHTSGAPQMIAAASGSKQPRAMPITSGQIRMARALLRISVVELARLAGVAASTITRCEAGDGIPQRVTVATLAKIRRALEDRGVEFTGGNGPGVRLGRRP